MSESEQKLLYAPLVGSGLKSPHRVWGADAIELGRTRENTSRLGFACEREILGRLWTGGAEISPHASQLSAELIGAVRCELNGAAGERLNHTDLAGQYRRLMHYRDLADNYRPVSEPFGALMDLVDQELHIGVWNAYNRLPISGNTITDQVRYVGEAVLVGGKELAHPLFRFGHEFVPDVRLATKYGVQFDGVLFKNPSWNSLAPSNNINPLLEASAGYTPLSLKVNFRARNASGDTTLNHPTRLHVRQLQNQIGRVATQFDGGKYTPLVFPEYACIAYLRGLLEHKVFTLRLDSEFYHSWLVGLSDAADPANGRNPDEISQIIGFMELLDRHVKFLKIRERRSAQAVVRDNREFFNQGSIEQSTLI